MVKMDDLAVAKQRLKQERLSLVFVKHSKLIFETRTEGLSGFLQAIDKHHRELLNSSVADRVIGKAAALLCVYSRVRAAFAVTLSQSGLEVLNTHEVHIEFEDVTPRILNQNKSAMCPFENLVEDIAEPKRAYERIRHVCRAQNQHTVS